MAMGVVLAVSFFWPCKVNPAIFIFMAGWALHYQKNKTAKSTLIASAFKNCTYRGKKWLLNRMRGKARFPNF
jgi:hypothetical protein